MDIASIIGIILALGCVAAGYVMDGGNLEKLWMLSAFIITVGGSLGSVAMSYGIKQFLNMPRLFFQMFKKPKSNISKTVDYIVMLAESARRDGLLSLEKLLDDDNSKKSAIDPLMKRGMLMVIDGVDLEQIRELMETEISVFEETESTNIATFETLAGFGPAFGMVGTIVGLIQVLGNMDSPEQMASAIGVAFITTLYGVLLANAICVPTVNKLRLRLAGAMLEKEVIVEGVCGIRNGQNPKMLRGKLSLYLQSDSKEAKKGNPDVTRQSSNPAGARR